MAAGWSTEETGTLVRIRGVANMQSQLDTVVHSKVVYEKITQEMSN